MNALKQRSALLGRSLLILTLLVVQGCGPSAGNTVPRLPGDGVDNLGKGQGADETLAKSEPDPWQDKELISAPAAKAPSAVPLPSIERFTLKNGVQVIAVQDASLPIVSMQVAIKTGEREDPREQTGLASFVSSTMPRGTKLRSAQKIAAETDAIGAAIQSNTSYETTLFSCKSLAKDRATCLRLLPDVLINPSFPESEIEIVRRNMQAEVRQRLDDAGQLASAHFQAALWGEGHIRGSVMSSSTIDAISRTDLVNWHKRWVRPNNAILAISGDFDSAKLRAELDKSFSQWKSATLPEPSVQTPPKLAGLKIRLIDKPGQTQSHIRIGHFGLAHRWPEFYPTLVFNHALGGGQFSSRLMKVVRSAEGKAYTASSNFDRNMEVGAFVAGTFTRSSETMATVKLMQKVIASMATDGPTPAEVSAAITNIAGSYATRFETADDVASALLAAELHGFDSTYVSDFPLQLATVGRDAAAAAARKILDPVNAVLVIVGDAKLVEPQLKANGLGYERISYTAPVSDWERAAKAKALDKVDDPELQAAARKLLKEALEVKGGAKRLGKLKSFHWVGDAALNMPTGPLAGEVEKRFSAADKLRLDLQLAGGQVKIATALSGKGGWSQQQDPSGNHVREFTPEELAALGSQLWRDADLVLLRQLEPGIVIRPLGERNTAGTSAQAINMARADGSMAVTLLIDPQSKLLLGLDYADQGMNTSERFGDYKNVQGYQIAHTRSTKSSEVDLKTTLKSFVADEAIAETVYLLPKQADK